MEPNVSYNVVHANNRKERDTQATALQENTAYNINERNPTQTDENTEYTIIENTGRERYITNSNIAYTAFNIIEGETCTTDRNSTASVLDNRSNTNRIKQGLAKNECAKKWLAILIVAAFVLALLVAVAALVYTNIELKNHNSKQNDIFRNLNDVQSILEELLYLGTINNPASSCSDIPQDRPYGYYWIATTTSSPVQVYCDMNRTSCSCNTAGGWMRVANLDMTDPNQNCPAGLHLATRTEPPLRTCGRMEGQAGCTSTTYSTYGMEYSTVCGRIIAYQYRSPDAFAPYSNNRSVSIDDVYVDGVSLTHGQSPRQHIWTFANALDETDAGSSVCPCTRTDVPYTGAVPPFIGQDYFCETGSRQAAANLIFYSDDPLWDGQGCGGTSTCCEFNNPPWFCKQLPQPTTDDIELRICGNQNIGDEDTTIEIADIYIR